MTERLHLSRAQLAAFLKDPQAIRQFEELFKTVDQTAPDGFNEVSIAAETARVTSQQALDELRRIADALETLALAPAHTADSVAAGIELPVVCPHDVDDLSPSVVIGTLGHQNADRVAISGGTIVAALTGNQTTMLATSVSLDDGSAAASGTLTNAPSAGNPTKWVAIDDNGTIRYIPTW